MDLSTGGNIPTIRKAIIDASPVPVGTVPIYEAISRVKRAEDLTASLMLEVIEEQAEQGVDYMTIHAGSSRRNLFRLCANASPELSAAAEPSWRSGGISIRKKISFTNVLTTSPKS